MIKAVIPSAGLGTRLRPVTESIPKALIHVADKPIIGHILSLVQSLGIRHAILVVGYLGEEIIKYATSTFPDMVIESVVQESLEGLGHAIWLTREKAYGDEVLIIYGDTILETEIATAFECKGDGALGVKEVEDPRRLGVVVLDGDRVTKLVEKPEKPPSNLALIGVSFFRNSRLLYDCLSEIVEKNERTRGEIQATDAFDLMVRKGAYLTTFPVVNWLDCGTVEATLETNQYLLRKGGFSPDIPSCEVIPPVFVGDSALVKHSRIGPFVTIASGARVTNCELRNCIVEKTADISGITAEGKIIG